jgi:hypothetical protein
VRIEGARVTRVRIPPDAVEDALAGAGCARVAHQVEEELELAEREVEDLASAAREACVEVKEDAPGLDAGGKLDLPAPEQGPDVGEQEVSAEGLGQVIVRPALHAADLVRLVAEGGQHEDGHGGEAPDAATGLVAILARHHDIEDGEGGVRPLAEELEGLLPVGSHEDLVALALEEETHEPPVALLVVGIQDSLRHDASMVPVRTKPRQYRRSSGRTRPSPSLRRSRP